MIETAREAGRVPDQLAEVVSHILFGATTVAANGSLVDHWIGRWRTYPGAAIYHEVESWLDRPDFTPTLDGIDVPAVVIHGEEDVALEPSRSEPLAEHLDAERVLVPEAGHTVTLENPAPVTDAVRDFLSTVY